MAKNSGAPVALALMALVAGAQSAGAQATSYRTQQFWTATAPNEASPGVEFSCMTGLRVSVSDLRGRVHTGGAIGPAIVIPITYDETDEPALLTVPTKLIVGIDDARAFARASSRSFISIPGTNLALETTGNTLTMGAGGAVADPFIANVLTGDAYFSQPGTVASGGSVYVAPGARADNANAHDIANWLGEVVRVQRDRWAGPGQTFFAAPVQACALSRR